MMKAEKYPTTTIEFDVAGKEAAPIVLQLGPTPGDVFAVYRDNPAYHKATREDWETCARNAIDRWAAIEGFRLTRVLPEWDRPFNIKGEYAPEALS
jgi:hypothetical protein